VVATGAGLHTAVAGGRSLPGQGLSNPGVESELRFFGAFYFAYGLFVLRAAPRADRDTATVRAMASALFVAGLARAGGWLAVGKPHGVQQALLAIELGAPPLMVAWESRLAR
jgi:hypothetical protein